jgi:hypothetical protein
MISDHQTVMAIPTTKRHNKYKSKPEKITIRTGKIEDTINALGQVPWQHLMTSNGDLQEKFDIFYDTVNNIQDNYQPTKSIKLCNDQPWMTAHLKSLMEERRKLFKEAKYEQWNKQANHVSRLIEKVKTRYCKQLGNGDSKKCWNVITQQRQKATHHKTQHTAEELNNGFHEVWKGTTQQNQYEYAQPLTPNNSTLITNTMVITELEKLQTDKAPGPDNISNKLLKGARYELCEIITHLFNMSIKYNFVPTQWKQANIIALPKINNPQTASDYRPIALTSSLCKVLERMVAKEIMKTTKNIWVNNKQYGFMPGKCTLDAIVQVIEDWEKAVDEDKTIHAVFFDYAKAFDLVPHQLLLTKISKMVPEWIVSWVAQYLKERKQRVKDGDTYSSWKTVEAGVIQGSVLGPILFLLFIADLNEYLTSATDISKYADDVLGYSIFEKVEDDKTQEIINGMEKWATENQMRLNINKTKHMIINAKSNKIPQVTLNNVSLQQVSEFNYLGVVLNEKLDYDQQWEVTMKITNQHIYLIKSLRKIKFKEEVLITVYKSITLSQFIQKSPLLISASNQAKSEMANQQLRFFRTIGVSPETAFNKYNIPPIENYIEQHCNTNIERMLKDPEHPIRSRVHLKRTNTRNTAMQPNAARTKKYQNSCLQKCLRTMRDGYNDKYTNPRRKETTTTDYAVSIQQIKYQQKCSKNNIKRLQQTTKEDNTATCSLCHQRFKNKHGLNIHMSKKHQNNTKK